LGKRKSDGAAGKWRRVTSNIDDTQAAQEQASIEVIEITSSAVNVLNVMQNENLVDLYSVGHMEVTRKMCNMGVEVPFQHTLRLLVPQGEVVRIAALFDGCAMVSAMCATVFEKVKHRLGEWRKSMKQLQMGNGVIIQSLAVWRGKIEISGITVEGEFEVLDSGGSWAFLLGKPLLRSFQALQDFETDTVTIHAKDSKRVKLANEIKKPQTGGDKPGVNLTLDVKQCDSIAGGSSEMNPPWRKVPYTTPDNLEETHTDKIVFPVMVTAAEDPSPDPESILTRESDPYKVEHVTKVVQEVTIGQDVTDEQRQVIQKLLKEYADCFALALKEVNTILGANHKLTIPEGAIFCMKIPPRSYNPDKWSFVNTKVDEMIDAGIIHLIHPSKVHFVAQTLLAQKTHEGQGLCIEELKHRLIELTANVSNMDYQVNLKCRHDLNQNQTFRKTKPHRPNGACVKILEASTKSPK
jgi:hypothetical protein